jgi:hypothetical protein
MPIPDSNNENYILSHKNAQKARILRPPTAKKCAFFAVQCDKKVVQLHPGALFTAR